MLISMTAKCDECGAERTLTAGQPNDPFYPGWTGDIWFVLSRPIGRHSEQAQFCGWPCLSRYVAKAVREAAARKAKEVRAAKKAAQEAASA